MMKPSKGNFFIIIKNTFFLEQTDGKKILVFDTGSKK